jgi:hypothetical protein
MADMFGLGSANYYLGVMSLDGKGCKKDYIAAESYFSRGFMSNACKYMYGVMHYFGLCQNSSKQMAALLIKQVYEAQNIDDFDKKFNAKAKEFWDEQQLWKYSQEKNY